MMEEEKEKKQGFRVVDKRTSAQATAQQEKPKKEKKDKAEKETEQEKKAEAKEAPPLPEVSFSTFVYSLSTSALVHLGEIPEPITEKMNKNLPLAKQTIDILGILQEKTKGNLNQDEENLLNNFLYDLRMRYVKAME
jgi:PBP1b-binding outer membrane lipoprotein LpoB